MAFRNGLAQDGKVSSVYGQIGISGAASKKVMILFSSIPPFSMCPFYLLHVLLALVMSYGQQALASLLAPFTVRRCQHPLHRSEELVEL